MSHILSLWSIRNTVHFSAYDPSRARRWIRAEKLPTFERGGGGTTQRGVIRTSSNHRMGVDPGSKREGSVAASAHTYLNLRWRRAQASRKRRTARDVGPGEAQDPLAASRVSEAASFHQSSLALETAWRRFCANSSGTSVLQRYQGHTTGKSDGDGAFPLRSGGSVVPRGTGEAGCGQIKRATQRRTCVNSWG
jgi:hypothetical protein